MMFNLIRKTIKKQFYSFFSIQKKNRIQKQNKEVYKSYVQSLRNKNLNKEICKNEKDLLYKCILCKTFMSPTEYGSELEKYLKNILNIKKAVNSVSGDGQKDNNNIEIKVSLSDNEGRLNYLQIRPDHFIDYYLFLAYNLKENDMGNVYIMIIPSQKIYDLIPEYAGYSHGTVEVFGKITSENIFGRNLEYSLRPNPTKSNDTKTKQLWNELIKYQIDISNYFI